MRRVFLSGVEKAYFWHGTGPGQAGPRGSDFGGLAISKFAFPVLFYALRSTRQGPCNKANHDVKLRTVPGRKYRYPDIMVVPADDTEHTHVANRAVLTVEVTSENSSGVDHDQKFHEYVGMPSVECYLIVSQAEPLVGVYQRTGTKWEYAFYTDLNDSFVVNSLDITMRVGEVYESVF